MALRHVPAARRLTNRFAPGLCEAVESVRNATHDETAGLAVGQVDVGRLRHSQDLVGGGIARLVGIALAPAHPRHLRRRAGRVVRLGVAQYRREETHRIDAGVDLVAFVLLAFLLVGVRLCPGGFGQQPVLPGDGQQPHRHRGGLPGTGGCRGVGEQ